LKTKKGLSLALSVVTDTATVGFTIFIGRMAYGKVGATVGN
jgi:hypothetical protein